MEPTVTEDTLPLEADSGIRRFVILRGDQKIIIQARQEVRDLCPGEIHGTDDFQQSLVVVVNPDLADALLALAVAALRAPRKQSLKS
jgi:hypothetical protein